MAENPVNSKCPLAKVADFGLARGFEDYLIYEKTNRLLVPWKWMAPEYLETDCFTLRSDVWSYGVLMWEIMSFGRMPYGQQTYNEVLALIESGSTLLYPTISAPEPFWSPESLYIKLSQGCFVKDPNTRSNFSNVIEAIESEMYATEKYQYKEIEEAYKQTRADNYLRRGLGEAQQ